MIPKLPLEFTSISFWLSAFINTFPLFVEPEPPPVILTKSFEVPSGCRVEYKLCQSGAQS